MGLQSLAECGQRLSRRDDDTTFNRFNYSFIDIYHVRSSGWLVKVILKSFMTS